MKYVALLRGIMPINPNMKNERLRSVFEDLGFKNVVSVISSGNIIFESDESDQAKLESIIENTIETSLGFSSTTIVRNEQELQRLADSHPFSTTPDTPKSRLNLTFLKSRPKSFNTLPFKSDDGNFRIFKIDNVTLGSVIDTTTTKTPNVMSWLEKNFGLEITTRTNKTLFRILNKM